MNFQLSPHFSAAELFNRRMVMDFGYNVTWFIDARLIDYLEFIRSRFGVVHVNDWYWGGSYDARGFRASYQMEGASMSQHRYGRAVDTTFASVTPQEVREDIKTNWKALYKPLGVTCIEDEINWVHTDMRHIPDQKELLIVRP
jgi:hypothetical protein